MSSPSAVQDPERLAALDALRILDTPPEPAFDDIVTVAAALCDAPVALVSLVAVDRQWFKARVGFEACETPLGQSVCAHVLAQDAPLIIPDLTQDPRTRDNPLVTGAPSVRFYAGAPLISGGQIVGSLCVLDGVPRPEGLGEARAAALSALARQTVAMMETRRLLAARDADLGAERRSGNVNLTRAIASEAETQTSRAAEARATAAQEAGRIGTFDLDLATEIMRCSAETCRIYGLPEQPAYPLAVFTDRLLEEHRALGATHVDGISASSMELRIRRLIDGAVRWIARRAEFLHDETGRPTTLTGTIADITERKTTELRQAALLHLGDELRAADSTAAVKRLAARTLGTALDASRAGYAVIDAPGGTFEVEHDWAAAGLTTLAGLHPLAMFGNTVAQLRDGAPLAVQDITQVAWAGSEADDYARIGTRAQVKVPLLQQGELVGLVFVHDAVPRAWSRAEVDFARSVADRTYAALAKLRAEGEQRLLNEELSHRLKNTLAIVQAIAAQTLRGASERAAVEAFMARLAALGTAHDVLLRQSWAAARIRAVVEGTLALQADRSRFVIEGPDINLGPRAVLSFTLLLHELATNALKHGALSVSSGQVELAWSIEAGDAPALTMRWHEHGGPPAVAPTRRGFGSRLIRMGLVGTGGSDLHYTVDGLKADFRAALSLLTGS